MNKFKIHYILMALFGFALFACESTESDYVNPDMNINGLASLIDDSQNGSVCAEAVTLPLQFEVGRTAGEVSISNDESYMYVTVASDAGFNPNTDPNILLWIGTDINDLPLNQFSFPDLDPNLYDYKTKADGSDYTFMVPLADITGYNQECGVQELVVFVASYVVYIQNGNMSFLTSYAGNIFVDGSAPWWYDTYIPQCCEDTEDRCETAYVKFANDGTGYVFASRDRANPEGYPSIGISNQQWGWAGKFTEDGTYEYDIWGAAGLNDTNKGSLVGSATIEIDGDMVTVTYNLSGGFSMDVVHIYVSNDVPTKTAPGQYGWTVEFEDSQTTYSNTFEVDGESDIWVIGHAEVCGPYPSEDDDKEEE